MTLSRLEEVRQATAISQVDHNIDLRPELWQIVRAVFDRDSARLDAVMDLRDDLEDTLQPAFPTPKNSQAWPHQCSDVRSKTTQLYDGDCFRFLMPVTVFESVKSRLF